MSAKTANEKLKLYVIRKYVMVSSAIEALKKEKRKRADDCWVDEDWKKNNDNINKTLSMGFRK